MVTPLPCTSSVSNVQKEIARHILEFVTPAGFEFVNLCPVTVVGDTPHRWYGYFYKLDNVMLGRCNHHRMIKKLFQNRCPFGAKIGQVLVKNNGQRERIRVEFTINCLCSQIKSTNKCFKK